MRWQRRASTRAKSGTRSASSRALTDDRKGGSWLYRREVPLSAHLLKTLASPEPDPETQLIALEERANGIEPEDRPTELPERLLEILHGFLPPEEAYLLEAHFVRGQQQSAIAGRLGSAKQSIQYRLYRASQRVRWAMMLESWNRTKEEMTRDLAGVLSSDEIQFASVLWSHKWNQSRTAQHLCSTPKNVKSRVNRLHQALLAGAEQPAVGPYARDLTRVKEARAWCIGSAQVQGRRAIKFPMLTSGQGRWRR
jgi:DNA-directed RNA polymerase specialized sigma24 family protein